MEDVTADKAANREEATASQAMSLPFDVSK